MVNNLDLLKYLKLYLNKVTNEREHFNKKYDSLKNIYGSNFIVYNVSIGNKEYIFVILKNYNLYELLFVISEIRKVYKDVIYVLTLKKVDELSIDDVNILDIYDILDKLSEFPELKIEFKEELILTNTINEDNFIKDYLGERFNWLIKEYVNNISKYKTTLFLGSGVSSEYGIPKWDELFKKVLSHYVDGNNKKNISNICNIDIMQKYELLDSFDTHLIKRLDMHIKNELYRNIHFSLDKDTTLLSIVNILNDNLINRIITYNYDDILERLLIDKIKCCPIYIRNINLKRDEYPIYHVHGYIPKDDKIRFNNQIVLSHSDYIECYQKENNWRVSVQIEAMTHDICVFIGNSLTDVYERSLLSLTKSNSNKLVLMYEENEIDYSYEKVLLAKHYKDTYGVDVIWCNKENIKDYIRQLFSVNAENI